MRRLVYISLAIIALSFALIVYVYTFEVGSRWLVKTLASRMDNIELEGTSGTLLSGIHLANVKLISDKFEVRVRRAGLKWRLSELFGGKLHLTKLDLEGVECRIPDPMDLLTLAQNVDALVSIFPIPVVFGGVTITENQIRLAEDTYDVEAVYLEAAAGPDGIGIYKLEGRLKPFSISMLGDLRVGLQNDLHGYFSYKALLPTQILIAGRCELKGTLQQLAIDARARIPLEANTKADLLINDTWNKFTLVGKPIKRTNRASDKTVSLDPNESIGEAPVISTQQSHGNGEAAVAADLCSDESVCMRFKDFQASLLGGAVKLDGAVQLMPQLSWNIRIDGEGLDPGRKFPEFFGRVAVNAGIEGDFGSGNPRIRVNDVALNGQLVNQPVSVKGSLAYSDGIPFSDGFILQSGRNRVALEGGPTALSGLTLQANLQAPGDLWPGLKGALEIQGTIRQDGDRLIGDGIVNGLSFGYGAFSTEGLRGHLSYDSAKQRSAEGRVNITNLHADHKIFSNLELNWSGDIAQHQTTIAFESSEAFADLELAGQCDSKSWRAAIPKASIRSKNSGSAPWKLVHPINLSLSHTALEPAEACWARDGKTSCASTSWQSGKGWTSEGDLAEPPISWISAIVNTFPDSPYGKAMEK